MKRIAFWSLLAVISFRMNGLALEPGVRGIATRAPGKVNIDGDLKEFTGAFCTPVCYFEADYGNRAAQFFYMWDDEAFYAGLRTLDKKRMNLSDDGHLWGGDAVEWYFDTRRGPSFRGKDWGPGAVHMYWSGFKNGDVHPRWCLRPDMLKAIPGDGVEVGARTTSYGAEVEFKLPWRNFPDFKAEQHAVIGLDAELCYSDGKERTYRTFAYGSPLSVQQPASQAKVELVDKLLPEYWRACGPVMTPIRCDTEWVQKKKGVVTGLMAIPPDQKDLIGKIVFRLTDADGATLGDYEGTIETLNREGKFYRARAEWPIDAAPPGAHFLVGVVHDKSGAILSRVAPRLVSVHNSPGY